MITDKVMHRILNGHGKAIADKVAHAWDLFDEKTLGRESSFVFFATSIEDDDPSTVCPACGEPDPCPDHLSVEVEFGDVALRVTPDSMP